MSYEEDRLALKVFELDQLLIKGVAVLVGDLIDVAEGVELVNELGGVGNESQPITSANLKQQGTR